MRMKLTGNEKSFIFMIFCMLIVMTMYLGGAHIINILESEVNTLSTENELLKTELSEYDNTTEIFPNYCIKCYCKDICEEAANELKEKKGSDEE